ncbi:hypothetical protein GCM10010524_63760 [Streptomyces mexicanus]
MAASRNLAEAPEGGSRYTTCVATLPTTQIIVSFIAYTPPSPGRGGRADARTARPVPRRLMR